MTATTAHSSAQRLSIFAVATLVVVVAVGGAFAAGFVLGRMWL